MRVAVAIVGAGIAGLSAAWELLQSGQRDLVVLEADGRAGGVIATSAAGGFLAESGPDSFLSAKTAAAELCRELGLEADLIPTRPHPAGARIWQRGRLHPLPAGWQLLAPTRLAPLLRSSLLAPQVKARLALRWRGGTTAPPLAGESAAAYLRRRFGRVAGAALRDSVAGPLLAGVYGGDAEELAASPFFPALPPAPPAGPSPGQKGASPFTSLRGGMGALLAALVDRLPPGCLRLHCAVAGIAAAGNGLYRIELANGEPLEAAAVVVATPAWAAATLLRPLDAALAQALAAVPYASSINLNLAYAAAPALPAGHGFLVSRGQGLRLLACTFAHQKFEGRAPAGSALLRLFYGGGEADWPADQLLQLAQAELATTLGLQARPQLLAWRRCPRAMPQYGVRHGEWVAAAAARCERYPGLQLAGNGYQGVGLPDCIASGRAAARALRP